MNLPVSIFQNAASGAHLPGRSFRNESPRTHLPEWIFRSRSLRADSQKCGRLRIAKRHRIRDWFERVELLSRASSSELPIACVWRVTDRRVGRPEAARSRGVAAPRRATRTHRLRARPLDGYGSAGSKSTSSGGFDSLSSSSRSAASMTACCRAGCDGTSQSPGARAPRRPGSRPGCTSVRRERAARRPPRPRAAGAPSRARCRGPAFPER
jgi:hypothetical protein